MPTDGHDRLEQVVLAPNVLDFRAREGNNNNNNINNNNNNNNNNIMLNLGFSTSGYARIVPRSLRTLIEFVFLLTAILSFVLLVCVHVSFSRMPANCLDHVKDVWPRDGILRVEIFQGFQRSHAEQTDTINELFTLEKSYEREYKLKGMDKSENKEPLFNRFTKTNSPENKGEVDIDSSTEKLVDNKFRDTNTPRPNLSNYISLTNNIHFEDEKKEMFSSTTKKNCHTTSKSNFSIEEDSAQFYSTKYPNNSIRGVLEIDSLLQSTSTKLPLFDDHEVIFYENHIIEYSLEIGFLMFPPSARNQSGIPVMLVGLNCTQNKYFGDLVNQFLLEYFLDYKDLLISSVKSLTENDQHKGLMRNVITGEYLEIINWEILKNKMSYIRSFIVTFWCTVSIAILMKCARTQIFISIVDFRPQLNVNSSFTWSAAPRMSLVLMAMIGMWAIMTDVFNDSKMAFLVILIVWAADQYNSTFSRSPITKKHWPKFFYLYHFLFYAYHHRFIGRYNHLALICSWSFIQHSMIYFYHHYELPYVLELEQAQQW